MGSFPLADAPGMVMRVAIAYCLEEWIERGHSGLSYRMTQTTSHGCFQVYLYKIKITHSVLWNRLDIDVHSLLFCLNSSLLIGGKKYHSGGDGSAGAR